MPLTGSFFDPSNMGHVLYYSGESSEESVKRLHGEFALGTGSTSNAIWVAFSAT